MLFTAIIPIIVRIVMYRSILLLILFFMNIGCIIAMEEKDSDEYLKLKKFELAIKERNNRSVRVFDPSKTIGSSIFINPKIRQKASLMKRSGQILEYIELVLAANHFGFHDKMVQFSLLDYLRADYLKFSTLDNDDEGECLDSEKAEELKRQVQVKGVTAFFERAVCYKIVAEQKYNRYLIKCKEEEELRQKARKESEKAKEAERQRKKEERSKRRQKILTRALYFAEEAEKDFNGAYIIDNNCKKALEFAGEVKKFIEIMKATEIDSKAYRLSLDWVKKAEPLRRDAQDHIISARSMLSARTQEVSNHEVISEEAELKPRPTRARRSRTFDSLKRKIIPKAQEKRRSLEETESSQNEKVVYDESEKKEIITEHEAGEILYIQVIAMYFEAFDMYRAEFLLDRIEKMFGQINESEIKRNSLARDGFSVRPEKAGFYRRLQACRELLRKEIEETDSSISE
jgi:hypothetical protein